MTHCPAIPRNLFCWQAPDSRQGGPMWEAPDAAGFRFARRRWVGLCPNNTAIYFVHTRKIDWRLRPFFFCEPVRLS